ncbi:MAG: hypothetical protein KC656_27555 [Myxococcales bacterium]|nr:hypothetical protein [Myxococcales bacterium]
MRTIVPLVLALAPSSALAVSDAEACQANGCNWQDEYCFCPLELDECTLEPIPEEEDAICFDGTISPPSYGTCTGAAETFEYFGQAFETSGGQQVVADRGEVYVCDLDPVFPGWFWGRSRVGLAAQRDFAIEQADTLLSQVADARRALKSQGHELTHTIQQAQGRERELKARIADLEKELSAARAQLDDVWGTCEDTCLAKDGQVLCGTTDHL